MATDKLGAADTRTPEEIEIHRLKAELNMLWHAGIIEVAVRNRSVADYMEHWEGRALKAEATISALEAENKRLREVLEPFKTFAEHAVEQVDDSWVWRTSGKERICDWFGPSDFGAARDLSRNRRETP